MASKEERYYYRFLKTLGVSIGDSSTAPTKKEYYSTILSNMLQITNNMFKFSGIEDSNGSPWWYRISRLQLDGYSCWFPYEGKHYACPCGLGGEPNANYQPTIATIANPYLKLSKEMVIGKDCVVVKNDRFYEGLLPWCRLYAWQMAEAYCTLRLGLINSRAEYLIGVSDDNQAQGALQFITDLEEGQKIAHLVNSKNDNFMGKDSNNSLPYSANAINTIRSAVESLQYLWSSWCSGMGLETAFNVKREYVSAEESTSGEQVIVPRVTQMMESIQEGVDDYNKLFGTDIKVEFNSIWKDRLKEKELEMQMLFNQTEGNKEETNDESKEVVHEEE